MIRAQAVGLSGGQLQEKGGSDTDTVETKQHSVKQENQFGKMAMLEKLLEPVFKKSAQSPVRNRHEIPPQAAGFGVWDFFLLFPPGATQCRVSFVQGAELGLGVTEASRWLRLSWIFSNTNKELLISQDLSLRRHLLSGCAQQFQAIQKPKD